MFLVRVTRLGGQEVARLGTPPRARRRSKHRESDQQRVYIRSRVEQVGVDISTCLNLASSASISSMCLSTA